jgi:hypothetical protein
MEGMTDTQKRLFKLRLKLNKGRKENKKEVSAALSLAARMHWNTTQAREEYKRFNDPKYEQKQRSQEYREKKRNWEEQMKV